MTNALPLDFIQMHGLGNDFVIFDLRLPGMQPESRRIDSSRVKAICDRHYGIGCDQMILITRPQSASADAALVMFNPDGSDCGACGNGTRCAAALIMNETGQDKVVLETAQRRMQITRANCDAISVDMGAPFQDWESIPLAQPMDVRALTADFGMNDALLKAPQAVGMGNPHLVLFVADAEAVDVAAIGARLEHHPLFPQRTNIEFVSVLSNSRLRMRVWERSTGITLACGSAACATIVAAVRAGLVAGRAADIVMDGGAAHLAWNAQDDHVILTGPVSHVFEGRLPQGFWQYEALETAPPVDRPMKAGRA